jgi:hypothetical protein
MPSHAESKISVMAQHPSRSDPAGPRGTAGRTAVPSFLDLRERLVFAEIARAHGFRPKLQSLASGRVFGDCGLSVATTIGGNAQLQVGHGGPVERHQQGLRDPQGL